MVLKINLTILTNKIRRNIQKFSYMVEEEFIIVKKNLKKRRNKLDICSREDIKLKLTNIKEDYLLAKKHRTLSSHRIKSKFKKLHIFKILIYKEKPF